MRKLLITGVLLTTMGIIGCNTDDDHHNHVTITFNEPTDGQLIPLAEASNISINISFVYEEEGEEIEVKLYPANDPNDLIIDHESHSHDNPITFMQDVDLSSYPAGTEFHLEAKACEDHDCEESVTEEIHFSLGQ